MSTVVHPISENPRLRIRALVSLLTVRQRLAALDEVREHLPLTDPDRHDLDIDADQRFAAMAAAHPEAAPAEVVVTQRRAALLHEVQTQGGRWKSGRTIRLYRALGYGPVGKSRAAQDLRHWEQAGHLKRHDHKGVTYYTTAEESGDKGRSVHAPTPREASR
jgi:hypothetical protein